MSLVSSSYAQTLSGIEQLFNRLKKKYPKNDVDLMHILDYRLAREERICDKTHADL